MKFLFALLAAIYALPVGNVSIKSVTSGSGTGHIEVTVGEEEWSYEWEELTEDVKDTVRTQLSDMGIEGGYDESGAFSYSMPEMNASQITSQVSGNPSNTQSSSYTSKVTAGDGEDFQEIIRQQQAKMLEWVKQYSESFYDQIKAQFDSMNVDN